MFKRLLYSLHRVLGSIFSILFVMWFLSGFVMIYHGGFPEVNNSAGYKALEKISINSLNTDSLILNISHQYTLSKLELRSFGGNPYIKFKTDHNNDNNDNNDMVDRIDSFIQLSSNEADISKKPYKEIEKYAKKWNNSPIIKVDTLRILEQWIPFSKYRYEMPIYKFYFSDLNKSQLYVSSRSGEAIQYTTQKERIWAYLGPIPHWVYFTFIRESRELWSNLLIGLSGTGAIMCLAGIILGIQMYIMNYKRKKKFKSPYRKFVYKWHHILGFFFGLFVFTFVFSGMMSLQSVPQWIIKSKNSDKHNLVVKPKNIIDYESYKLNYKNIISKYSNDIKSIEWAKFGNIPFYKVIVNDTLIYIDASKNIIKPLLIEQSDIVKYISNIQEDSLSIKIINQYDNYYISKDNTKPLPVYKVEVFDDDKTIYYVDPKTGNIQFFDTNTKIRKWIYQGIHSLLIKCLIDRPIIWNIVMWTILIGGTGVAFTGLCLSIKYVRRKYIRRKK